MSDQHASHTQLGIIETNHIYTPTTSPTAETWLVRHRRATPAISWELYQHPLLQVHEATKPSLFACALSSTLSQQYARSGGEKAGRCMRGPSECREKEKVERAPLLSTALNRLAPFRLIERKKRNFGDIWKVTFGPALLCKEGTFRVTDYYR